jgi:putative NIF3 family GTP cyclohydrolase 1 type 2
VRLDDVVRELDAYFRVADVRGDDWATAFAQLYPEPYWRDFVEPEYEGRWNGLMIRGAGDVSAVATCVFPSDRVVGEVEPGELLFSEHPVDLEDERGFLPLSRESFETLRTRAAGFYHVHAPLDMHPEVSPSRLIAQALGLANLDEFAPIAEGIPGGAAILGESTLSVDEVAERLSSFLGAEIPVRIASRHRDEAGRVAVLAGGGASPAYLELTLERRCDTYVTGNAITGCRLDFVQEDVRAFTARAEEAQVSVVDGTHYGTEKPPQLEMVRWFERLGLPARFVPDGPK